MLYFKGIYIELVSFRWGKWNMFVLHAFYLINKSLYLKLETFYAHLPYNVTSLDLRSVAVNLKYGARYAKQTSERNLPGKHLL